MRGGGPAVGHTGAFGADDQPCVQLRVVRRVPCFTLYASGFGVDALRCTLNAVRLTLYA